MHAVGTNEHWRLLEHGHIARLLLSLHAQLDGTLREVHQTCRCHLLRTRRARLEQLHELRDGSLGNELALPLRQCS